MMSYRRRRCTTHQLQLLMLVFILITSSSLVTWTTRTSTVVVGLGDDQSRPNPVEIAIGINGDPSSPWDKLKYLINVARVNLLPPPRASRDERDAVEVIKEAATKSFETSKEAAEKAAQVAGQALHDTVEKVIMKKTITDIKQADPVRDL